MVVPRPFFDPTAAAAAGRFSLSEPLSHGLQSWPETFASSAGGPGPVSPAAKPMRASMLPRIALHAGAASHQREVAPFNAPTRHLGLFGPFPALPKSPQIQGKQTRHPLPRQAGGVVNL